MKAVILLLKKLEKHSSKDEEKAGLSKMQFELNMQLQDAIVDKNWGQSLKNAVELIRKLPPELYSQQEPILKEAELAAETILEDLDLTFEHMEGNVFKLRDAFTATPKG